MKIILFTVFTLLLISCGNSKSSSVDDLDASSEFEDKVDKESMHDDSDVEIEDLTVSDSDGWEPLRTEDFFKEVKLEKSININTSKSPLYDDSGSIDYIGRIDNDVFLKIKNTRDGNKIFKISNENTKTEIAADCSYWSDFLFLPNSFYATCYNKDDEFQMFFSDGTTEGTKLILFSETLKSANFSWWLFKDTVYIVTTQGGDDEDKEHLYTIDKNTKEINLFHELENPDEIRLTVLDEVIYIETSYTINGNQLWQIWSSHGTVEGTQKLLPEFVEEISIDFENVVNSRKVSKIVFSTTSSNNISYWFSNGSPETTFKISSDITSLYNPQFVFKDKLYFVGFNGEVLQIYYFDETSNSAEVVFGGKDYYGFNNFLLMEDLFLFACSLKNDGPELCLSDGTEEGSSLLKNINENNIGSYPEFKASFNNKAYFTADHPYYGIELWQTDGTDAGTTIVEDFFPCSNFGSEYSHFAKTEEGLYFAVKSDTRTDLWKIDKNSGNPIFIKTPHNDSMNSEITSKEKTDEQIYFISDSNKYGNIIWKLSLEDDSIETIEQHQSDEKDNSSNPKYFTRLHDKLFLTATGNNDNVGFWLSDGTEEGIIHITDTDMIQNGDNDTEENSFKPLFKDGEKLYFLFLSREYGFELGVSDGSEKNTKIIDINKNKGEGSFPSHFTKVGSKLFFTAIDGDDAKLWIVQDNGEIITLKTTENVELKLPKGKLFRCYESDICDSVTKFKDKLAFFADDGVHGIEPWITDGTPEGTFLLKDINPDGSSIQNSSGYIYNYKTMAATDTHLYFKANDGVNGEELWVSSGTENETRMVKDINPGPDSSQIRGLTVFESKVYFKAVNQNSSYQLWRSGGSEKSTEPVEITANLVNDTKDGEAFIGISHGKLFFELGSRLWAFDGKEAISVYNIDKKRIFREFIEAYNTLYFLTADLNGGYNKKIGYTDGTVENTYVFENEINPYYRDIAVEIIDKNLILFQLDDSRIHISDGTKAGTKILFESDENITDFHYFKDKILLSIDDRKIGNEIFPLKIEK